MVVRSVNVHDSTREAVESVLNEGSDILKKSDSGSEENIADSGEESVPVDLKADLSDSNNCLLYTSDAADER